MRWLGRISIATTVLFAALVVFWSTAPLPLRQNIVFAATPVACFPNPNASGPPNMTNGCPLPASILNMFLNSNYTFFVVTSYGAKGDGTTNDTGAFNSAEAACQAGKGGFIYFPPTGASYRLVTAPNPVPSGCQVRGMGGMHWPGPNDNVESDWTGSGTWFRCEDTVNTCFSLSGNGSSVSGVNFWYTQPTPPTTGCVGTPCAMTHNWTPTTYPYTITVGGSENFNYLSDINIVNATHCVDFEGPSNGVAGIYTYGNNLFLTCFVNGIKFHQIDDTISLHNIRHDVWWFPSSSDVLGYTEGDSTHAGHKIDWELAYVANLQASDVEFGNSALAMHFTDATVTAGFGPLTLAAGNMQLTNISFNEVCQAMSVAATTTHITGDSHVTNIIAYADTGTSNTTQCAGNTPNFFNLNSDNVNITFNNTSVGFINTLINLGNGGGTSRAVFAGGMSIQQYSAFTTGLHAFVSNNGHIVITEGLQYVGAAASAGSPLSGTFFDPPTSAGYGMAGIAGTARQLTIYTTPSAGGLPVARWGIFGDTVSESGSNAGTNLALGGYNDAGSFLGNSLYCTRSNGGCAFGGNLTIPGTYNSNASQPTIFSGFGTSPSVVGSDNAGRVTLGTTPGTTGILNFGVGFIAAPACAANYEGAAAGVNPVKAAPSGTQLALTWTGTPASGEKISFVCIGIQ